MRPVALVSAPPPDFTGKRPTKTVPPKTDRLVTDVDAAFEQDVFDLALRQWIADVHHYRQADYLGRTVEITKGIVHHRRLRELAFLLKPVFSDNAHLGVNAGLNAARDAAADWMEANAPPGLAEQFDPNGVFFDGEGRVPKTLADAMAKSAAAGAGQAPTKDPQPF